MPVAFSALEAGGSSRAWGVGFWVKAKSLGSDSTTSRAYHAKCSHAIQGTIGIVPEIDVHLLL